MKRLRQTCLLVLFCLLVACTNAPIPLNQQQKEPEYQVIPSIIPVTVSPESTPIPGDPTGTALAFYDAWERREYGGMYSLLSAGSKRTISQADFIQNYEDVMDKARVNAITYQPLDLQRNNPGTADMRFRVTWETAVVGTLVREHVVPLTLEEGNWRIRWGSNLILPEMPDGGSLRLSITTPSRAPIYDKGDTPLTFQGAVVTLGIIPGYIEDEDGMLAALSQMLLRPPQDIYVEYADLPELWFIPIATISVNDLQKHSALLAPYFKRGLSSKQGVIRLTNEQNIAPHLLGQMGEISAGQWPTYESQGYQRDEVVGLNELEYAAESYLLGKRGARLSAVSRMNVETAVIADVEALPGRIVHTTFESGFQLDVQEALAEAIETHYEGHSGAIVVLDVNSGDVLAMASYPQYNPNVFNPLNGDQAGINRLLTDQSLPLLNRATSSAYPPGSTFKIITMAAALHTEIFDPKEAFKCEGFWDTLGEELTKYDWKEEGHGDINIQQALAQSCNIYSYEIGYQLNQEDRFLLPDFARQFGLGDSTDFQLTEVSGTIPDPEWKLINTAEGWGPGDSVNMAIGQGFVTATPLQIAAMTAAIANGGTVYQPNIIDRIEGNQFVPEQDIQPIVLNQLPLSEEYIDLLQRAMNDVTSGPSGTAVKKMSGLSVSTAGKTGTAEVGEIDKFPHSWFTGYAPVIQPEIAIAVIIENAGEGSNVAAPVFRRVVELYYDLEPIPYPTEEFSKTRGVTDTVPLSDTISVTDTIPVSGTVPLTNTVPLTQTVPTQTPAVAPPPTQEP